MSKTITQLPVAAVVTPNAVLATDNAAGTATEKVTIGQIIALAPVQSVANKTGAVALSAADVGLGSVNNTADSDKPISNATQTALNGKAALNHSHDATAISGLAPIATSGSAADLAVGTVPPARLPVATADTLGGVKQGTNVTIDGSGVLTANAPSFASITDKPTTLAGYGITDASGTAKVDAFTISGTWTKPAGAKAVIVHTIGGGGGGGGGGNRAAGTVVGGGGGGGGGGRTIAWLDASLLPNSVPVTVGAGGLGGTGGTGAGNGTAGTEGGSSFFGNTQSDAWCFAFRGTHGVGGSGTGGSSGAGGPGLFSGGPGSVGAAGGNAANATTAIGGGGGGGGGQGLTAASVRTTGGLGASVHGGYGFVAVQGAGAAGRSVPTNAPLAGTGANGGQSTPDGDGLPGGPAGRYGGGGGGGGACTGTEFRAGAGGAGAQGIVVVTAFF